MKARLLLISVISITIAGSVGCSPKPCPKTAMPLEQLVGDYNANASPVYRLWARARIKVAVALPGGFDYDVWGSTDSGAESNGLLMLFKSDDRLGPQDFVLLGREAGIEVFRTGCSLADRSYYFWCRFGDKSELLWGRNRFAGAPGTKGLPIDPMQILAVLGICELPWDFTSIPTVALSMNTTPGQCAYVLTYLDRQPVTNRLLFRREVYFTWEDGKKPRPFRVEFFDAKGVRVMKADLKDYKPILLVEDGNALTYAPEMPTNIKITWPTTKAFIEFALSEMQVNKHKGLAEVCNLWDNLPPNILKRTQIDRYAELETTRR